MSISAAHLLGRPPAGTEPPLGSTPHLKLLALCDSPLAPNLRLAPTGFARVARNVLSRRAKAPGVEIVPRRPDRLEWPSQAGPVAERPCHVGPMPEDYLCGLKSPFARTCPAALLQFPVNVEPYSNPESNYENGN